MIVSTMISAIRSMIGIVALLPYVVESASAGFLQCLSCGAGGDGHWPASWSRYVSSPGVQKCQVFPMGPVVETTK